MGETATYVIELAVGLACVVVGVLAVASAGRRWIAFTLIAAGTAAVAHAAAGLAA